MIRLILIFLITFLMVMQASAQPHRGGHMGGGWGGGSHWAGHGYRGHGYGGGSALPGVLGGILGGYLWRQWNEPNVVIVPQEPIRDIQWCIQRYRSYNPDSRVYLGFDGQFHACP